jgi:hypothetical protein
MADKRYKHVGWRRQSWCGFCMARVALGMGKRYAYCASPEKYMHDTASYTRARPQPSTNHHNTATTPFTTARSLSIAVYLTQRATNSTRCCWARTVAGVDVVSSGSLWLISRQLSRHDPFTHHGQLFFDRLHL